MSGEHRTNSIYRVMLSCDTSSGLYGGDNARLRSITKGRKGERENDVRYKSAQAKSSLKAMGFPSVSYGLLCIPMEFLCNFYGVSMQFLHRFPARCARKQAVFPRNFTPVNGSKKIAPSERAYDRHAMIAVRCKAKRSISGSILDRFWVDPGSILGRSWVDPGFVLGWFWPGKPQEHRPIHHVSMHEDHFRGERPR